MNTPTTTPATTLATTPAAAPATGTTPAPSLADQPVIVEAPDGPTPEREAADLRELDNLMLSQAPRSPEAYPNPDLPGLSPLELSTWKTIAHSERLAPSEFAQFATALNIAALDAARGYTVTDKGYQAKTVEQLRRAWGDDFDRQIGFARAEARRWAERYPQAGDLLTQLPGNSEFIIRQFAQLGARRAARK